MIATTVRCFFREESSKPSNKCLWLAPRTGTTMLFLGEQMVFGDSVYDVRDLKRFAELEIGGVTEITPEMALRKLGDWPDSLEEANRIFLRHEDKETA